MTYAAENLPLPSKLVTTNARKQLTKMVMRLFSEWKLTTAEQLKLVLPELMGLKNRLECSKLRGYSHLSGFQPWMIS